MVLFLFIFLKAFFSSLRFSLFSVKEEHLSQLHPGSTSKILKALLSRPRRTSTSLLLLEKLCILGTGVSAWFAWNDQGGTDLWVPIALSMTLLSLGKSLFTWQSLIMAPQLHMGLIAWTVWFADLLISPLSRPIDALGKWLSTLRARGSPPLEEKALEQEVIGLVERGRYQGAIEKEEHRIIHRVLEFGERKVAKVMTPRADMFCLPATITIDEAIERVKKSGYSRVPVYGESKDDIVGILFAKDMLKVMVSPWASRGSVKEILRPPYFVPVTMETGELLRELRRRRLHMALCVDEFGGIAGLVTMEDVLEELFGEIYDEYDLEIRWWEEAGQDEYLVSGKLPLHKLEEITGARIEESECHTVAGLILEKLGRFPSVGDMVEVGQLLLQVEKVTPTRVQVVRAKRRK